MVFIFQAKRRDNLNKGLELMDMVSLAARTSFPNTSHQVPPMHHITPHNDPTPHPRLPGPSNAGSELGPIHARLCV